ncbi:terminase gpA endonuclease subunit [Methylosinus trichosporium]|uniref:terminase gpA endonuclease subunit n=1 Tax=Methylosinus trichosporium TaxID=426 RepID=UPI003211E56E
MAGFHLSALYSPFESWGEIAAEFVAVHKVPLRLKPWTNTKLGEPFEDRDAAALDPAGFLGRLEDWSEGLPEGVLVITAGVDVQNDRLALEVVGWGVGEESWSLDYSEIWGDPAKPDLWATLDGELTRLFDHSRACSLPVRASCVDSGGHHTQTVYRYARDRATRAVWAIKGRGGRVFQSGREGLPEPATRHSHHTSSAWTRRRRSSPRGCAPPNPARAVAISQSAAISIIFASSAPSG